MKKKVKSFFLYQNAHKYARELYLNLEYCAEVDETETKAARKMKQESKKPDQMHIEESRSQRPLHSQILRRRKCR